MRYPTKQLLPKRTLLLPLFTGLIFSTAFASAADLPEPVMLQAHKLLLAQFPTAKNIKISSYEGNSSDPTVNRVLQASTKIEFQLNKGDHPYEVVMLPDGENLLVGSLMKPDINLVPPSGEPLREPASGQDSPILEKPVQSASLEVEKVRTKLLDKYRLSDKDFKPVFENPAVSTAEFSELVKQAHTITTGTGPFNLYIFTDPNCPNCRKEYELSSKYQDAFTFHWIPIYAVTKSPQPAQVALNDPDPNKRVENLAAVMRNPKSAALLELDTSNEVIERIRDNQILFYNLKNMSTPVTVFTNKEGLLTAVNGHSDLLFDLIVSDM